MIGVNALKNCLLNHPDYKKLGTTNIEESINMLKYFIYIDKGGVHLKGNNLYSILLIYSYTFIVFISL